MAKAKAPSPAKSRAKRTPSSSRASGTTTTRGTWQHVTFRVRHTPDYMIKGTDHVELIVIAPKREPLPITQTGYLSHFVIDVSVPNAKDGLAFFLEWIEHEAQKSQKTVSTVFAEPLPTIEASIDESLR